MILQVLCNDKYETEEEEKQLETKFGKRGKLMSDNESFFQAMTLTFFGEFETCSGLVMSLFDSPDEVSAKLRLQNQKSAVEMTQMGLMMKLLLQLINL